MHNKHLSELWSSRFQSVDGHNSNQFKPRSFIHRVEQAKSDFERRCFNFRDRYRFQIQYDLHVYDATSQPNVCSDRWLALVRRTIETSKTPFQRPLYSSSQLGYRLLCNPVQRHRPSGRLRSCGHRLRNANDWNVQHPQPWPVSYFWLVRSGFKKLRPQRDRFPGLHDSLDGFNFVRQGRHGIFSCQFRGGVL